MIFHWNIVQFNDAIILEDFQEVENFSISDCLSDVEKSKKMEKSRISLASHITTEKVEGGASPPGASPWAK